MTVKQMKTVKTLIEAMPWIRRFWGKVMVIQPDGVTATSPRLRDLLAAPGVAAEDGGAHYFKSGIGVAVGRIG